MKKYDWILVIGLVLFTWALDQITKSWANSSLSYLKFYGPLGLVLHHNPGAILGSFTHLPPVLRVVSLSTGGAFLVFIYAAIQYLLPSRSLALRSGMSLLLGGILGNVTDRILHGAVTDFLVLGSFRYSSPAFNAADAIQWVGYFLVVYALLKEGRYFWPDQNARKSIWVNPRFQLKYCFALVAMGLCFALISGVFSFTYLKITIDDLVVGPAKPVEWRFLIPFLSIFVIISMSFMLMLFIVGRILSHRTAGPIFALEQYLDDLLAGKDRPFRLRQGDEFKHLEEVANRIRPHLLKSLPKGISTVDSSQSKKSTRIAKSS